MEELVSGMVPSWPRSALVQQLRGQLERFPRASCTPFVPLRSAAIARPPSSVSHPRLDFGLLRNREKIRIPNHSVSFGLISRFIYSPLQLDERDQILIELVSVIGVTRRKIFVC